MKIIKFQRQFINWGKTTVSHTILKKFFVALFLYHWFNVRVLHILSRDLNRQPLVALKQYSFKESLGNFERMKKNLGKDKNDSNIAGICLVEVSMRTFKAKFVFSYPKQITIQILGANFLTNRIVQFAITFLETLKKAYKKLLPYNS